MAERGGDVFPWKGGDRRGVRPRYPLSLDGDKSPGGRQTAALLQGWQTLPLPFTPERISQGQFYVSVLRARISGQGSDPGPRSAPKPRG